MWLKALERDFFDPKRGNKNINCTMTSRGTEPMAQMGELATHLMSINRPNVEIFFHCQITAVKVQKEILCSLLDLTEAHSFYI